MIAIDTNVLVYAHREDSEWHSQASASVRTLATGRVLWGLPGPMVHDAKVAALCLTHGVTEFWTADRDFSRFPSLPVRNPLLREH